LALEIIAHPVKPELGLQGNAVLGVILGLEEKKLVLEFVKNELNLE